MILTTIEKNFAGYLRIFELDCFFAFSDGYSLKIIPKPEDIEPFHAKCKEQQNNFDSLRWIHAVDSRGYDVAFQLSERQMPMSMCYCNGTLTLITDIVLQTSNSKDSDGRYLYDYIDLKGFTTIDFAGDAVNAIFSPKAIINKDESKNNRIEWLPTEKYAKSFPTEINGKKCSLIFSVIIDRQDFVSVNTNLGELHSFIRLEFDERQDVSMIEPSWQAVCTLLTFCVGQYNVTDLQIGLWDEKDKIGIRGFQSTIYCQINGDKVEGIRFSFPADHRFQVDSLGDKAGSLFKLLNDEDTRPILSFLPRNNYNILVDQDKVRDLCTALEVEFTYDMKKKPKTKKNVNSHVTSLVTKLQRAVKDYKEENPGVLSKKFYDKVGSTIGNISLPASEQLWHIYSKYNDIIKEEIKWDTITPVNCSESQTIDDIEWIVKVRNGITHSTGPIEYEIPNVIYYRLRLAVYCSILERSGYLLQEIADIMKKYFGRLS